MSEKTSSLKIIHLNSFEERMLAFPLVKQMYDELDVATYQNYLHDIMKEPNYFMLACVLGDKIIGIGGYWILTRFYAGRMIQVGNLVVDKAHRKSGVAKMIMSEIEKIGREKGCQESILDSYMKNSEAHKFFFREGYAIKGFHFMKTLGDPANVGPALMRRKK